MSRLEIKTHEDKKIVEVWLTNAEQEDADVKARLNLLYAKYKNDGYTVAVFKSGRKDLFQCTAHLLRHNRMKEAAAQKNREQAVESL